MTQTKTLQQEHLPLHRHWSIALFQDSSQRSRIPLSHPEPHVGHEKLLSVVDSLKRLQASKGARNAFNYDSLDIQRVQFLPPTFNGDVLFELPPVNMSGLQTHTKLMHGMDNRRNGHAWTKTITSHIKNDMSLMFYTSIYVGHLNCENQDCKYTSRIHRISPVNKLEWDGFIGTKLVRELRAGSGE
jgi:hypothetical protein